MSDRSNQSDYGKHAALQATIVGAGVSVIRENMEKVIAGDLSETLSVCDYGAADGSNSLPIIKMCRAIMDENQQDQRDLLWIFNDISTNTFNHLFNMLERSFDQTEEPRISFLTSGTSFYRQVLPRQSIHFGLCLTAIHWLSESPADPQPEVNLEAWIQSTERTAAEDWTNFLLWRAAELKTGPKSWLFKSITSDHMCGRLVVTLLGAGGPHKCPESRSFGIFGPQPVLKEMYEEKVITKTEYGRLWFLPFALRSEKDIRAPFENGKLKKTGLCLVSLKRQSMPDINRKKWEEAGGMRNEKASQERADKMVGVIKSVRQLYESLLDEDRPGLKDRRRVVDHFLEKLTAEAKRNLGSYSLEHHCHLVEMEKVMPDVLHDNQGLKKISS